MGSENEYDGAKQFLDKNRLNSVGTLSSSEWEVASKKIQIDSLYHNPAIICNFFEYI